MTIYNSNGSVLNGYYFMNNESLNYFWKVPVAYSEFYDGNYIFYANITGTTLVGMTNVSNENNYNYNINGPFIIKILSPENKTFNINDIWFDIILNEKGSWCGYSLNDAANITMPQINQNHYKLFLTDMLASEHNVIFYCNNSDGLWTSKSRKFNITPTFVVIKIIKSDLLPVKDISDKYISSNNKDTTVTAIVHATGSYKSSSFSATDISLTQRGDSKAYIVYTKGDVNTIENRINYVKNGNIEKMPNPSFGFGIDKKQSIMVALEYSNINITGIQKFGLGFYQLNIENNGKINNKPIIKITKYTN